MNSPLPLNGPGTALPWADHLPWVFIIVVPGVILGILYAIGCARRGDGL